MKSVRILVVSDSHGCNTYLKQAIQREKPFDYLIHCGDIQFSLDSIDDNKEYEILAVKGNTDSDHSLDEEQSLSVLFQDVWVVHGDKYHVKREEKYNTLREAAKKKGASIVLFGHTHQPEIYEDRESYITLINPGSIGEPRTKEEKISYAVLTLTDDYDVIPEIKYL